MFSTFLAVELGKGGASTASSTDLKFMNEKSSVPMGVVAGSLNELFSALLVPFNGDAGSTADETTAAAPAVAILEQSTNQKKIQRGGCFTLRQVVAALSQMGSLPSARIQLQKMPSHMPIS